MTLEQDSKDAWEGFFPATGRLRNLGITLAIQYTDGEGNATQRVVDVRDFCPYVDDAYMLLGHCRLRNATRTFLTNRISLCADAETGEVVRDIPKFLIERYRESPYFALDRLWENHSDAICALLYFGRLTGALKAPKREILRDFCRDLAADSRLSEKQIDGLINDANTPTLNVFRRIVGRLNNYPPLLRAVLFCHMMRMEQTSKNTYATEIEALGYVFKRWKL